MSIDWREETFRRTYGDGSEAGTGLGSTFAGDKAWWRTFYQQRIVPIFGTITGAQRILVVGCGLGLLVESIRDTGFANIYGIDRSAYVASRWPTNHPSLAQLDILTVTAAQLRSAFGRDDFHWIVTESVCEGYPPEEQAALYAACERLLVRNEPLSHVVHLVYPDVDMEHWPANALEGSEFAPWAGQPIDNPGCPARTLEQWQASRPAHTFLSMIGVGS